MDGLTGYLSDSSGPLRSTRRTNLTGKFEQAVAHEDLNLGGLSVVAPWLSRDARLYGFVLAYYVLVFAELEEFGFGEIVEVGISGLDSSVYATVLLPTETVAYATVNQVKTQYTEGLSGIARGTRQSSAASFDTWEYIEALDGPGWDEPIWVSSDDCEIILRQDGGESGLEITSSSESFIARRSLREQ